MPDFEYHEKFEGDVEEALDYYARESTIRGLDAFYSEVEPALEFIALHPLASPALKGNVRRKLFRNLPYGIYYRVIGERIFIGGVLHLSRHPDTYKNRFS